MRVELTAWRIRAIPEWSGKLDLQLVVETTATSVVETIERVLRESGFEIERVASVKSEAASR